MADPEIPAPVTLHDLNAAEEAAVAALHADLATVAGLMQTYADALSTGDAKIRALMTQQAADLIALQAANDDAASGAKAALDAALAKIAADKAEVVRDVAAASAKALEEAQ